MKTSPVMGIMALKETALPAALFFQGKLTDYYFHRYNVERSQPQEGGAGRRGDDDWLR